jgi:zinc transport system substrate-binding protein
MRLLWPQGLPKPERERRAGRNFLILVCLLFIGDAWADGKPLVVSTVRPLHLILLAIAGDAVEARSLPGVRGTGHEFVLRPSDMRLLQAADQIFWIGPALERPFDRLLQRMHSPAHATAMLAPSPGTNAAADPHIWLDPRQAIVIATRMTATLEQRGLLTRGALTPRLEAFTAQMQATERAMNKELEPVRQRPLFVMHDGYGHLVRRFGLNQAGALTLDEEHAPGARTLTALRTRLQSAGRVCLLTEPGVNIGLRNTLIEGSNARVLEMDPLAYDSAEDEHAFALFLRDTGHRLAQCLGDDQQDTQHHE